MAMFPANPTRLDPYKNFKFRLKWDGQYVAAVSKMSSLKRTTEVVDAPQRRRPIHSAQIAGPQQVRRHHAGARTDPGPEFPRLGGPGLELRFGAGLGGVAGQLPQGHLPGVLQRSRTASDGLQDIPLLGLGVPGNAGPGCECERHRHRAHQVGKRGLGARHFCDRAGGTDPEQRRHVRCAPLPKPIFLLCGRPAVRCIRLTRVFWPCRRRSHRRRMNVADWPLGRRNRALAELRCASFGAPLRGWTACRRCTEQLEFQIDSADRWLRAKRRRCDARVTVNGRSFRLPTSRDLAAVVHERDSEAAARRLLRQCVLTWD